MFVRKCRQDNHDDLAIEGTEDEAMGRDVTRQNRTVKVTDF